MTVIAVTTLIVAVVGATFAYFSINVSSASTSTTAVVTTAKPGSVVIDGVDKAAFYLKVSAADMAMENKGTRYYALDTDNKDAASNNGKIETEADDSAYRYNIARASLTEGEKGIVYTCNYTVTINADPTDLASIVTDDLVLNIYDTNSKATKVDLTELKTSGTKTINGEFTLNGPSENKYLKASLYLTNRDDIQDYLADQKINITISVTGGACEITSANP